MKMKNLQFSKYCTPAQLYLVLGAIGIITAFFNKFSIETLLTKALFLVVWAWVLNWLCSKGFKAISWILVLLPFIMALFTYFLTKDVVMKEGFSEGFYEGLTDAEKAAAAEKYKADALAKIQADKAKQEEAKAAAAAAEKERLRQAIIAKREKEVADRLAAEAAFKKLQEEKQAAAAAARKK